MVRNNESFIRGMEAITLAGAIALGTAACSSAEADKPTTTIEQTMPDESAEASVTSQPSVNPESPEVPGVTAPSEGVSVAGGSETTEGSPEAQSDREVIGSKEILSANELVDLYNKDPESFENYFKLRPQDFNMTPEQIYNNPRQFAELYAQMSGALNSAVLEMPATLYHSGGYNGLNSLPDGVTREQYNEAFRAAAEEALRLSRHCRDHVDEPDETTAVAFDSLQEIYALVVGIIEGYSGLAEEVDVRLELAPYEVTVNGQSVRVVLQSAEGNGVSFPETSHPGFSIAGNAADGNRLTTTHVGLNPEDGTLVLGNAEVVPPLFQQ